MDPLWIMGIGLAWVVVGILLLRLHAFLALLLAAWTVAALTSPELLSRYAQESRFSAAQTQALADASASERVAQSFGNACGSIGILIALAAIIGKSLLESGAAERLVRSALQCVGETRAPAAFLTTGFVLGTPVFFDTVFYLMIPLGKALALHTGRHYALYVMSIIAGATMAHSLVPPTPGPLMVASQLGIDLGTMMLAGIAVGIFTVAAGYLYARWTDRHWPKTLSLDSDDSWRQLAAIQERDERALPSVTLSVLPIVLPVLLIAGGTLLSAWAPSGEGPLRSWMRVVSQPNVALALAVVPALWLLARHRDPARGPISTLVREALNDAGLIILITSAGGALGGMMQQCGAGWRLRELAEHFQIAILPLAFGLTALVRCAQGSATVAMITSVGMIAPLVAAQPLGFHPVYVALAIGCGSKPFPWMNDSGFWVINQMSGLTLRETFRYFSFLLTGMGLVGLVVVMIAAKLLPLQ